MVLFECSWFYLQGGSGQSVVKRHDSAKGKGRKRSHPPQLHLQGKHVCSVCTLHCGHQYIFFTLIITARIPSLREGNVFSHVCLLKGGGCSKFEQAHLVGGSQVSKVVRYGMQPTDVVPSVRLAFN